MAEDIGNLAIRLSIDSAKFEQSMASIDRNLKAMGQEMRGLQNHGNAWGASTAGLTSKQEALSRMLDGQGTKVQRLRAAYEASKAATGENSVETERLAIQLNRATAEYNRTEAELAQVTAALQRQADELRLSESSWTRFGETLRTIGATASKVGKEMTKVGKEMSMKVTAPIVAMGVLSAKAAIDFESAFAGIRKTVTATEEEFAELEKGIRDMAKAGPSTAVELAAIGESAGQLGIATENILAFTSTVSDIAVATNMTAEQAATDFARFANITKMPQTEFDKLGSSIVALGNNFATTESEIMGMAMRLAGAGAQVGMSEADILGLSTALTSVGIEAEMGGSAISKAMVRMQLASTSGFTGLQEVMGKTGMTVRELQMMASHSGKAFGHLAEDMGMTKKELTALLSAGVDLENFGKIAGMTGEEFKIAFEKDAVGALGAFINGLGTAEEAGDSAINMLQEMGISEVRLRDALLRAGNASELFAGAVDLSNKSWDENNALTKEAAQRYATTASQLETFKNKMVDLGITLGGIIIPVLLKIVEAIEPWIEKFAELSKSSQKVILVIAGIAAAIGPVLVVVGALVSSVGAIMTAFGTASMAIAVMTTGVASAVPGVGALAAVFTALTGPIGIAVAAIAAVGVAVVVAYKKLDWFRDGVDKIWNKIKDSTSTAFAFVKEIVIKVTSEIASFGKDILGKFSGYWESNGKSISESVKHYFGLVKDEIERVMRIIQGVFEIVWPIVSGIVITAWASIKTVVLSAIDIVLGVMQSFGKLLEGDWKGAWESIVGIAENIMNNIISNFKTINLEQIGRDMIQGFINGIMTMMGTTRDELSNQFENMKGVISEKLSNIKESIATRLDEWKTSITSWFTSIPGVISVQFVEWETAITTWFKNMPGVIITQLIEWGNAIKSWAIEQNAENIRQFSEWGSAIVNWLASIPSVITENLAKWAASFATWFSDTKTSIVDKFAEWTATIVAWFVSIPDKIRENLAKWSTTFAKWFVDTRNDIIKWFADWTTAIAKWFKDMPSNIGTWLVGWWTKISTWFSSIPAYLTAKLEDWWKAIKAWFASVPNKPEIKNMGKNMIDKVAAGNQEKKAELLDKLGKIIVNVALGALAIAGIALIATGREIIKRLISGIQEMKAGLETKMKELGDGIVTKMKEVDLAQVGKDIIQGLINGIGAMAKGVWDKAKDIGQSIIDSMSSVLERKSPSRVMMRIGEDTSKGLIIGMDNQKGAVEKSAKATGESMVDAITGVSKVLSATTKKNAAEIVKIDEENEKKRIEIKNEYAKKRAELDRKTNQSSQTALKTSKNKKGEIVTTGTQRVHNIHADASAKLRKLNDDEQKKLVAANDKAWKAMTKKEEQISKERLDAVKLFIADKKSTEELSLEAEAAIWKKSVELFANGTKEKVAAQAGYKKAMETIDKERLEAVKQFIADKKSLEQLSVVDEVVIWKEAVDAFKAGTKEKITSQIEYGKALDEVNKEVTSVNKKYADEMMRINDNFKKQEEDLTSKYESTLNDRMKALYSFAGTFDEFDTKVVKSGAVLLKNLGTQVDGFKEWQKEIEKLAKRAIDDGLIAELKAMGPKALPELMALNSLTDTQLSEYSALYQEKSALARTQAEAELIGMKEDTGKQIGELRKVANKELSALQSDWQTEIKGLTNNTSQELSSLNQIGRDAVQGLVDGMKSMHAELKATADGIAEAVSGTIKKSLQIKSPSRVMHQMGVWTIEGFVNGLKEMEATPASIVDDIGKAMQHRVGHIYGWIDSNAKKLSDAQIALQDLHANRSTALEDETQRRLTELRERYERIGKVGSQEHKNELLELDKWYAAVSLENEEWLASEKKWLDDRQLDERKQILHLTKQAEAESYVALKDILDKKRDANEISALAEMQIWKTAADSFTEQTSQKTESMNHMKDAHVRALSEIEAKNEVVRQQEIAITAEYTKAVDDRAKSIMSFASTFDEFKVNVDKSGQDLMGNLQGQVDGFKSWQENIAEFSAKAIDEGLIAELKAMGPKALGELQALNKMTDAELSAYSDLYQEKQALARNAAEKELVGLKTDTQSKIQDLKNAVQSELEMVNSVWNKSSAKVVTETGNELSKLKSVGQQAGQGLLDGLASMEEALVFKAQSIAEAVKTAMTGAFDIHSPSRWMRDMIGKNMMVGWINGMESMRSSVLRTANASAEWMKPSMPNMSAFATPQYGNGSGGNSSTTTNNSPTIVNNYYQPINSPSELSRKQTQDMRNLAMQW